MDAIQITKDFHALIDKIDNEQLLLNFYEMLKYRDTARQGVLWGKLSKYEQNEIIFALEESRDETTLKSHEEIKKKHQRITGPVPFFSKVSTGTPVR